MNNSKGRKFNSKEEYAEWFKGKTKQFAIDVISFCDTLLKSQAPRTVSFQLIKSSTSTGANYRAACRARSKAEFHSKMSITVEEADESLFWLEIIEGTNLKCDKIELKRLMKEIDKILRVISRARKNATSFIH